VPGQFVNWVEASVAQADTYVNSMSGTWIVPRAPDLDDTQLLYFFLSATSSTTIVQPVLQYGFNGAFGGYYWTMAVWLATADGGFVPTGVPVNPNDSISGGFRLMDGSPGNFFEWYVWITDTTTGQTNWDIVISDGNPFDGAQQGVLEAYQGPLTNPYAPTDCRLPRTKSARLLESLEHVDRALGLLLLLRSNCASAAAPRLDPGRPHGRRDGSIRWDRCPA
jgi:hypothetical protein